MKDFIETAYGEFTLIANSTWDSERKEAAMNNLYERLGTASSELDNMIYDRLGMSSDDALGMLAMGVTLL